MNILNVVDFPFLKQCSEDRRDFSYYPCGMAGMTDQSHSFVRIVWLQMTENQTNEDKVKNLLAYISKSQKG
jgi:hypothetical protein